MFDKILQLSSVFKKEAEANVVDLIKKIKPEDILTVYHGTSPSNIDMVRGVDATQEYYRHYGGPRHKGLFVAPDFENAKRFGPLVLELEVPAKDLHGSDWSGFVSEQQVEQGKRDPDEIWKDKYPESFRPYLSSNLLAGGEPQGLYIGLIKPDYIKRVYFKDNWYSVEDLYKNKNVKSLPFDPTDDSISLDDIKYAIMKAEDVDKETVDKVLKRLIDNKKSDRLQELLEQLGWVKSVAKSITDRLLGNKVANNIYNQLKENCPVATPDVDSFIDSGMQGEVYNFSHNVIKFQRVLDEEMANEKIANLNSLINLGLDIYPKVLYINKACNLDDGSFVYYYVMEKLKPAEGKEEISFIINNKIKNKSIEDFENSPYLQKANDLYEELEKSGTIHVDVNPGAIMEDKNGNLKLADIDSVVVV